MQERKKRPKADLPADLPPDLPLRFPGLLVIVGGGTVDTDLVARLAAEGAQLVAADGGADHCEAAGVVPHAIVGDMDSLSDYAGWAQRTRIVHIAEQDSTDLEKCLYATEAPLTLIVGATGKRLDHTLAMLDVLARYGAGRHMVLIDEADLAVAAEGAFSFRVAPGERVSVHPLTEVRFARSAGLFYPLDGLTLAPGFKTGTSNRTVFGDFEIVPEKGSDGVYLVILDKSYLDRLILDIGKLTWT